MGLIVAVVWAAVVWISKLVNEMNFADALLILIVGPPFAFLCTFFGLNQFRSWRDPSRRQRALDAALPVPRPVQGTIDQLARLRSDAIHDLLNRRVATEIELGTFIADQEAWRQRVLSVLRENFPEAVVLTFDRLGSVPVRGFGHAMNPIHGHQLEMLALRIEIIQKIVDRYTA